MLLIAFMQASNCSNYTGSWRHPETSPDYLDLRYYQDIARTLEDAKFHMAFIDDRLAMPSRYGDSYAEAVEYGVRVVKLDLVPVITAMGLATSHLGLGATYSTTYYSPFHVARVFASLDHFTNGRGRLERSDLAERLGGPQLRGVRAPGARRPLRRGRRVHGGCHRAVGLVGRRRGHRRPGAGAVRRRLDGAVGRLRRAALQLPGAADHAPAAAGPSGNHPGRPE